MALCSRLRNNLLQKLPTQFEDAQIEILYGHWTLSGACVRRTNVRCLHDTGCVLLDCLALFRDLTQNKFASVPETIWRMRNLRVLDLSSNQVASCVDPLSAQPLNASLTSL